MAANLSSEIMNEPVHSIVGMAAAASEITATAGGPQNGITKKFTIVGAGMAGLYAAWRLAQSGFRDDVWLLEMTDRIGGRLDTVTFGGRATVELGGMRFSTGQKLVTELIKDLGLTWSVFPETDNALYYLRGKHVWQREMKKRCMPPVLPYGLTRAERRKTPDDLLSWAVGNAIGNPLGWDKWTPRQWHYFIDRQKYSSSVYRDVSYLDVGFWDLLRDQLTNEGYRYVTDGGGYDSNTINWNSAIAMPYLASGDYTPGSPKYQRIDGGYHKLPEALAAALSRANVPILQNTRLTGFAKDGNGMIDCKFDHPCGKGQFKTQHLFLCAPPRSLELLDPDTDFASDMRRSQYFESVIRQPSFKLLFLYEDRWYRRVKIRGQSIKPFGPTITDLPLRMIWYFDPEPSQKYWALLASYCDMASTEFWSVMKSAQMIEMARAQLRSVHNIDVPEPIDAVFKDWGRDPYGAGYHAWAAHCSPSDMFDRMLQPIPSYNVYICGEAYSLDQGWVEGALSTVDECLERLKIQPYQTKTYITVSSGRKVPVSTSFGLRRL
jgi:lysine 2-monooxygenase